MASPKTKTAAVRKSLKGPTPAPAPTPPAPETVTWRRMAEDLAVMHDLPKKTVEALIDDLTALTGKYLKKGVKVRASHLGIFQLTKRAARKGHNPATGEAIKIKASKSVGFKVARDLKENL